MVSPRSAAGQTLDRYWDKVQIPVDIVSIAGRLGIAVMTDPYSAASGHYQPNSPLNLGRPLITYNSAEHPVRQRFTIAHEIGHHVLGHGAMNRDTPAEFSTAHPDQRERDANAFAAELLMPSDAVNALIQVRGVMNIETLAQMFNVSRPAMTYRLKDLGYGIS